jgi:DNA-binding MurR/RpiR family transcriptional regulator
VRTPGVSPGSFLARIQATQPQLPPVQRRILDFFLSRPQDAVFFTTTAVARELGVSEASVVRLGRALRFDGYRAFQAAFCDWARKPVSRVSRVQLVARKRRSLTELLVDVGPRDVALGISFERYAKVSIELFEACVGRGATGIALTDRPTSPRAQHTKHVLVCRTPYLTFIDSYVAPFSLANAILSVLAVQRRRAATRSLARMEKAWQLMDTYC